jgi:lipoprotein NlpI
VRQPGYAYGALWLAIAAVSNGKDGVALLTAAAPNLDEEQWPAPVVAFYLGKTSLEDMFKSASAGDAKRDHGPVCEANFYAGIWQILHADMTGTARLTDVAKNCSRDFVEWPAANAALARLASGSVR